MSKGVGRRRRRWLRTVEIVVIEKKQEEKEVKKEDDYDLNVKTEKIKIASDTFSPPKSSLVGMRPYFIARLLKELSDSFNFKGSFEIAPNDFDVEIPSIVSSKIAEIVTVVFDFELIKKSD